MDSNPRSEGGRSFKAFGWQGINLTIPSDWTLVVTRGGHKSGYIRLADQTVLRMEMRWQAGRERGSPSLAVDRYLARLRKKARKSGWQFDVSRNLKLAAPPGKRVECYRWVADRQAVAMLSHCERCGRMVHVHLLGKPKEHLKGTARTVFASLKDHPEGESVRWAFHDVEFESPAALMLRDYSLKAGRVRMEFARPWTRLELVRMSVAEVLLARKSLEEWFREVFARVLKRRSISVRGAEVKGHPGVRVDGRAWLVVNPTGLLGRRRIVRGTCWHCEETNRLMFCCFNGPQARASMFQRAVDAFPCC